MLIMVLLVTSFVGCAKKEVKVTITFAHNQGESSWPVLQKFADRYKEISGNTVEFIYVPAGEYNAWLPTQFAAGNAPDIIMGGIATKAQMAEFYNNKWLADLTPYMDKASSFVDGTAWKSTFLPGVLNAGTVSDKGNKVIGVPLFSVSKDLYYNTEIFKKVGIEKVPETLSELLDVCEKIKKDGRFIPMSGMIQPTLQWNTWFIERAVMVDFWNDVIPTLDIMNPNGELDLEEQVLGVKAGIMNPDDQRMVDYFSYMKKLAPYFQKGFTSADWSFEGLFNEGKSAMTTNGMWYLVQHKQNALTVPYGVARIPYADKAVSKFSPGVLRKFASQGEMGLVFISQKAVDEKRADAAAGFVNFLTDPKEGARMVADGLGFLPTVSGVEVNDAQKVVIATKGDENNPMPEFYLHSFTAEANQKYCVMFADFLTNDVSAEDFVKNQYKPLVLASCDEVIMLHPEWKIVEFLGKLK